jgi:Domain of unknown function (DUF4175)
METDSKYLKEIVSKLEKLVKKESVVSASFGIQVFLIGGLSLFVFLSFIEMLFHFSSTVRTVLFILFIIAVLASAIYLIVIPLLKYFGLFGKSNYFQTASEVGKHFPSVKDDLLNAMQLVSLEKEKHLYSEKLIDASFYQVYKKTKDLNFTDVISFKKAKALLKYASGTVFLSVILIFIVPSFNSASFRLINFGKDFTQPPKYSFEVTPGDASVTKGDNISIQVKVNGGIPANLEIATKDTEQTNFEITPVKPDSNKIYNYTLKSVRNSFKYFVQAENVKSKEFSINVIDRPIIKNLDLTITSPSYSHIPEVNQKDDGNVAALLGSKITMSLNSTKNIKTSYLLFSDSTKINLKPNSNSAEGSFILKGDKNYQIILTDIDGNQNASPITYSLKTLYDAYPSIEMIIPNRDVNLSSDNRLPLEAKINDDYGFTKLLVRYKLSESKYQKIQNDYQSLEIPIDKNQTENDVNYIWNLSPLSLTSEDVVTYYLEVFDNDFVSGPKSAKTNVFAIRVPSLDEILADAENTNTDAEQNLNETMQKADEMSERLENINMELKQNKKDISWEEKQKIQKSLDDFKDLQQKADDVKKELAKMQQNLQDHNILSKETLDKYMELQKLMDEFSSDDMKKAMEQLQNELQNLDREQVQNAMQNFKFNEEQFKNAVERTLSLLKRIQAEQKIDQLKQRTDLLSKQQSEINKNTDSSDLSKNSERNTLSEKQNDITKSLESMNKEMKDLSQSMNQLTQMPTDEMNKLQQSFQEQNNRQLSQNTSQQLQNQQKSEAQQNEQQLSKNFKQLGQDLDQLKSSMTQKNQLQTFRDIMKVTDNTISLSKQQEELKNEQQKLSPLSSMRENAEKQNEISRNLDKVMQQMSNLSNKSFAISPEMGKALGDAKRDMYNSLQAMENENPSQAELQQQGAMEALNQAAAMMKYAAENMIKGGHGQGGGFMSLMQQFQQMSQQQMKLNDLTQMLQQGDQGKLTMEQQAELQRLATQQDVIKKSLDELNREAKLSGQSKRIPGDLDKISQDMQEVVTDMHTQKLNDNLIQKQQRILSRMLDAQKSVNEKDFENNRESNTGTDIVRKSPGELNFSNDENKGQIVDELIKAVQEGYTRDYEDLIRRYFEALQKENVKN